MLNTKPKVMNTVMDKKNYLRLLIEKSNVIHTINTILKTLLPEDIAPHCEAINVREDTLVLRLSNASWSVRLHYELPELLEKLQTQFKFLKQIKLQVYPVAKTKVEEEIKTLKSISTETADLLKETAKHIGHQKLAEALERLASH